MKPYEPNELPLTAIDWMAHVSLIGKANAALARYDGILQGIVNPSVMLSPLTTQEAVLSSKIEGTQATLEEVLEFEADDKQKIGEEKYNDIQEIVNYRVAMAQAVEKLKSLPLCLNLLRDVHQTLLASVRGRNRAPGEFRRVQNFIGPPGCTVETATFVPPSPANLLNHLGNWEKYIHYEERDPLVQLAVIKAQFEIIHPFLDGNGRIGRMLVPLFLYDKKVLSSPMFYISAYFEKNRPLYYERLKAISRDGDWNGWIAFFLTAVAEQAEQNSKTAKEIMTLYGAMKTEITGLTHSQFAIQTIDTLFDRPIFRSSDFIARSKIPKPTGMRILAVLRESGLIKAVREGSGRRPAVFAFCRLVNLAEGRKVV